MRPGKTHPPPQPEGPPAIAKIVSGGQTGADQGALDAALWMGIPCGGWCPRGRRDENGVIPERFPLIEDSEEACSGRTERNVRDSHATLLLTSGPPTGGSRETLQYARRYQRPCLTADLDRPDQALLPEIMTWLDSLPPQPVLNVAGSRESKDPGIQRRVENLMKKVWNH